METQRESVEKRWIFLAYSGGGMGAYASGNRIAQFCNPINHLKTKKPGWNTTPA